ncbi:hypothetical protein BU24DRAFT_337745 [Aaosphaeria arxii CBS 175.79]|uniref:Zn(2)-C6 fungal-type domain-containing protein n=1 Tax=Aaosphaeria arxii CBS 175.79 TaxID=1450172 RepID=A0A6A5Y7D3_9PLEO|nr:uncharacterized protein BU24DRAFT_337745 [Aaosphaeria arxii CBS 175.79]KAF2020464.1 hypothetical protein BU24DRAFT_337745 [Aaosphaeria arxii CBS 175.79]
MSAQFTEGGDDPSRRNFACERCSRRKQRCDRKLPSCSQCLESGSVCNESNRENNVIQLNDKEITRKGYVTALQERIAYLEAKISGKDGRASSSLPTDEAAHSVDASADTIQPDPLLERGDMDMNALSMSALAEPRSRTGEFLKQLSMPRIIAGMTETYGGNPEETSRVDSLWDGIAQYIRQPSSKRSRLSIRREEALKALDTYIVTVDFRFPRLSLAKVRSGIDAITDSDESYYRRVLSKDPSHIFMAYMTIGIVPLISEDYPISQGSFVSIHILAKCMELLDRVFAKEDGVDIIQCLHLLVIFSMHCSAAGSAWHLIGFAMNKCIALGYHQEPLNDQSNALGIEEMQEHRWAFWGCYFLDRLICAALDRPYSIDDPYISVKLPGEDQASPNLTSQEACQVHLFRYARMLSSAASHTVQLGPDSHLSNLIFWRASSPALGNHSNREAHLHQTSLYHTLMLRNALCYIVSENSFDRVETNLSRLGQEFQEGIHSDAARQMFECEVKRSSKLKLLNICQAVAKSLDRRHMSGRHYLSVTTGYSAFSLALATLHCQLVLSSGPSQPDNIPPLGSIADQIDTPGSVASDAFALHPSQILDIACQKLEIVGRQFPRLQEYRLLIERLRRVYKHRQVDVLQEIIQTELRDLEVLIRKIGPVYVRKFALVGMAPFLSNTESTYTEDRKKLYILSEFHPTAVKYAQSLFDCILHTDPEAANWRNNATAILIKDYYITDADLAAAPQLRVIGKQGVGLDKVDVAACERRGVKICNTPGVNAGAVAEMTLCLAFSVARQVPSLVTRQRIQGEVIRKETISGLLLSNKTVGVIGMGNIGQAVSRMFVGGLGASIVTYDPYWPEDGAGWKSIAHTRVHTLEELLKVADVVTVHVPLTATTKDLIAYEQMKLMKRNAILLNTARGGIVNEDDLAKALEEELIWGAGFDCHVEEPPTLDKYERLWNCERFVGTPHVAAAVDETQIATINAATDGVWRFLHEKSS